MFIEITVSGINNNNNVSSYKCDIFLSEEGIIIKIISIMIVYSKGKYEIRHRK